MHQPPQESIWGNINTCMEIALNIYMIVVKDENGLQHNGIMARKSTANKTLSPKAIAMGEEDGEWVCYDESKSDIPLYEVLKKKMEQCKKNEAFLFNKMQELKRDGKILLTDYFGECAPPVETPMGPVADMLKIRNGIFLTQDSHNLQFTVHESVAEYDMSPIAAMFGQKQGEYLYYDTTTAAIPLNELRQCFDEVDALVISEDSLNATLCKNFSVYCAEYNAMVPEDSYIPETDAPTSLFLQVQLEAAKSAAEEVTQPQHEPDFSEETDFEVGR